MADFTADERVDLQTRHTESSPSSLVNLKSSKQANLNRNEQHGDHGSHRLDAGQFFLMFLSTQPQFPHYVT